MQRQLLVLGISGAGPNLRLGSSTGLCQLAGWLLSADHHAGHLGGGRLGISSLSSL